MLSYFDLVPEAGESELLQVHFAKMTPDGIPPGIYAFTEHFCDCPSYTCPCVMIEVYREAVGYNPEDPVAVFTFNFVEKKAWFGIVRRLEATEFELDAYTDQARYAEALMNYWRQLLESDSNFAYRVQCHRLDLHKMLLQENLRIQEELLAELEQQKNELKSQPQKRLQPIQIVGSKESVENKKRRYRSLKKRAK